jgi:hypothetical protein
MKAAFLETKSNEGGISALDFFQAEWASQCGKGRLGQFKEKVWFVFLLVVRGKLFGPFF